MDHQAFLRTVVMPWKDEYDALPVGESPEGVFHLHNDFFESVDAETMYAVVRHLKPARIIEIGSGWSTLLIRQAIAANGTPTDFLSVSPEPTIPGIEGTTRKALSEVEPFVFAALRSGDILTVDGSHKWSPGSDVDIIFRTLPSISQGVWVHFHDIFLPDPYIWDDRGYDEQDHLQAFLSDHDDWEALFSAHQAMKSDPRALRKAFASFKEGVNPGSFWMVKS